MNPLFRYLFNCNRKKIAILYFGFMTISLLFLFNMKGLSKLTNQLTKDITLGIYVLIIGITAFLLLLIALPSFNKMLKNTMIRYTAISGKKYICKLILFHVNVYSFTSNRLNFSILFLPKYLRRKSGRGIPTRIL